MLVVSRGIVACRIQRCGARFQRVLAPQMYRTQSPPLASVANIHASVDSIAMDGNSKVCLRNIHHQRDLQSAASRREYGSIRASNIYHGKALVQTALPGLFGSTSLQKVLREGGNQGYTRATGAAIHGSFSFRQVNSSGKRFFHTSKGSCSSDGKRDEVEDLQKPDLGYEVVEVNKRNLVRAMSGSVGVQLLYWYSIGAFDDMFERFGLIGPSISDPLFGSLDPYIGGIGATLTVANLFLARIFTNKIIGRIVLHPSGKLCSLWMYTMPFGKLEERVVNIRDIVDYNVTDNYYTLKVDGDRTFLMVDRTKASYGDDSNGNERLLRHIIGGNPVLNVPSNMAAAKTSKVSKADTTRQDSRVTEEKAPTIKLGGKRKRRKRKR